MLHTSFLFVKIKLSPKTFITNLLFLFSFSFAGDSGRVPLPLLPDPTTNFQWDEVKPLSGKPYCHCVLSPTNLHPRYYMVILYLVLQTPYVISFVFRSIKDKKDKEVK